MPTLVLTTVRGLEEAVKREAVLRGLRRPRELEGLKGRIVAEGSVETALGMRTVETVALLLGVKLLAKVDTRSVRLALRELLRESKLEGDMRVRAYVFGSCFTRRMLELVAARELARVGARPNPESARSVRVELSCIQRLLAVSLQLNDKPLHLRSYYRWKHPTPLNPVIAAALPLLGGLKSGDVVYDPFCGSGTVPIESSILLEAEALASDWKPEYAAATVRNAEEAGARVYAVAGDASAPPFRGGFDAVVTDPPRGRDAAKALAAALRLAASYGVKTVIATPYFSLAVKLAGEAGLKLVERVPTFQGGRRLNVLVFEPPS